MPSSADSSSRNGCAPGSMSTTYQRSEPGSAPRRSAGTRPARTTDDLPEPDGPTTAGTARARPPRASDEPLDEGLASEEVARRRPRGMPAAPCRDCASLRPAAGVDGSADRGPEGGGELERARRSDRSRPSRSRGRSTRRRPAEIRGEPRAREGNALVQMSIEQARQRGLRERIGAGQHLVQHDAERVDVGSGALPASSRICSGDRYARRATGHRPRRSVRVRRRRAATPKSVRYAFPSSSSSTLPGLTSRCTTPWRWAAASADATWSRMLGRRADRTGRRGAGRCEVPASQVPHDEVGARRVLASSRRAARCAGARAGRRSEPRARSGE